MRCKTAIRRIGFTLVEVLVVLAIVTLLTALLVGASYRFIISAREAATLATVTKINGIIQDRVNAFRDSDFLDAGMRARDYWNSNNSSDPIMTERLAEVLIRKTRFKKAFPQAFAELDAATTTRFFGSATIPPASPYNSKYECGIVLYALLTKGETFGAPTPGTDTFTGAEVKNSAETGGLPCLVDGWGEPIRFYRWPTRLLRCGEQDFDGNGSYDDFNQNGTQDAAGFGSPVIRPYSLYPRSTPASLLISNLPPFERTSTYAKGPDGLPGVALFDDDQNGTVDDPGEIGWPDTDDPEFLNTDPDDPTFRLSSWLFDTNLSSANQAIRRTQFVTGVNGFHDFYTFHTPLVVSAGPDKLLGLWEPTDVPTSTNTNSVNFGYLANPQPAPGCMQQLFDNITNLNQRAGGK